MEKSKGNKSVTIKDVAEMAGVSSATVSRVLSGKPYVRQKLIDRVIKAVDDLDFHPSRVARTLRSRQSRIIGLIISDIMNPFFTELVRAVEDTASQNEYAVFLCNSDEEIKKEAVYIELMQSERVAGLLFTPTQERNSSCQRLISNGVPVVTFDRKLSDIVVDTVLVNNERGTYQAVEHLILQGHQRIAIISADENKTTGRERLEGFRKAHEDYQIPLNEAWIFTGSPKKEMGREAGRKILKLNPTPTAIFCGNNLITMGVISTLLQARCRIPEDYAIISFDDMEWYTMATPTITAIQQPVYEIGKTATELLLKRIQGLEMPIQEVRLETQLIVRESSNYKRSV